MQPVVTQLRYYITRLVVYYLRYENRVIVVSLDVISQLDVSGNAIGCPRPIAALARTHGRYELAASHRSSFR